MELKYLFYSKNQCNNWKVKKGGSAEYSTKMRDYQVLGLQDSLEESILNDLLFIIIIGITLFIVGLQHTIAKYKQYINSNVK